MEQYKSLLGGAHRTRGLRMTLVLWEFQFYCTNQKFICLTQMAQFQCIGWNLLKSATFYVIVPTGPTIHRLKGHKGFVLVLLHDFLFSFVTKLLGPNCFWKNNVLIFFSKTSNWFWLKMYFVGWVENRFYVHNIAVESVYVCSTAREVVYMCIYFYSMQYKIALLGCRHACNSKTLRVSHLGLIV